MKTVSKNDNGNPCNPHVNKTILSVDGTGRNVGTTGYTMMYKLLIEDFEGRRDLIRISKRTLRLDLGPRKSPRIWFLDKPPKIGTKIPVTVERFVPTGVGCKAQTSQNQIA